MSNENQISLVGLDKAAVLAALYNNSRQQGMGFLQPRGSSGMSTEEARKLLDGGQTYFDYLHGRVMKIDLKGDTLDTWLYNRDNGDRAAERVIEKLRNQSAAA